MTVFMLMIAENTPTTSDVTPLIGKFFVASMVEIGLALIATCFVLNIYESTGPSSDVPACVRMILLDILGPILCVCRPRPKPKRNFSPTLTSYHTYAPMMPESNGNSLPTEADNNPKEVLVYTPKVSADKPLTSRDFMNSVNEGSSRYRGGSTQDRLLEGINVLTERARDQERSEGIKEEWELVAKVVDRLFLIMFLATVSISTAMIFLQRPSYSTL